jgi:hypothetical protein
MARRVEICPGVRRQSHGDNNWRRKQLACVLAPHRWQRGGQAELTALACRGSAHV